MYRSVFLRPDGLISLQHGEPRDPPRRGHSSLPRLFQHGDSEILIPALKNRPSAQDWFGHPLRFIVPNYGARCCNTAPCPTHNYRRCTTGIPVIAPVTAWAFHLTDSLSFSVVPWPQHLPDLFRKPGPKRPRTAHPPDRSNPATTTGTFSIININTDNIMLPVDTQCGPANKKYLI